MQIAVFGSIRKVKLDMYVAAGEGEVTASNGL